jgi:transcriptional regulator with XRE-family HTH domain
MIGEELREARLAAGLTQSQVGRSIGISHTEVSRIERATTTRVPFETLALIGAVLGQDISLRAYPNREPIRDVAQLDLLARFRKRLPPGLTWRSEVPLAIVVTCGHGTRSYTATAGGFRLMPKRVSATSRHYHGDWLSSAATTASPQWCCSWPTPGTTVVL